MKNTIAIALRVLPQNVEAMKAMVDKALGVVIDVKPTCSHTRFNIIAAFATQADRDWCAGLAIVEDVSEVEIECSVRRLAA